MSSVPAGIGSVPPWSPTDNRKRDKWMLHNWLTLEPVAAAAMNRMIEALSAKGWVLVGPKKMVRHTQSVLTSFQGLNKGCSSWASGTSKQMATHYLATDLGPKMVAFHDDSNLIQGMALLDPSNLTDSPSGWLYHHPAHKEPINLSGRKYDTLFDKPTTASVLGFSSIPPSTAGHYEVGRCAFSLILNFSEVLISLFKMWRSQLSDSPSPGVAIWRGISESDLKLALIEYEARLREIRKKGEGRVPPFPIFDEDMLGVSVEFQPFSITPESLDVERILDLYFWIVASSLDVNESFLRTIKTGSFGNGEQAKLQKESTERLGERAMVVQLTNVLGTSSALPNGVTIAPDDRDTMSEHARNQGLRSFIEARKPLIDAGVVTPLEVRQMAIAKGLLDEIEEQTEPENVKRTRLISIDPESTLWTARNRPKEPLIESRYDPKTKRISEKLLLNEAGDLLNRVSFPSSVPND